MQSRFRLQNPREIERRTRVEPAAYVIFDILEKDGLSLVGLPLVERKEILRRSVKEGRYICIADCIEGRGEDYFRLIAARGLEGIVAKRKSSCYEQGLRSDSWLKIKNWQSCDCIIFGYKKGVTEGNFQSVLVGLYDSEGKPVYVGNVEYGFTREIRRVLSEFFKEITIKEDHGVVWVKPVVVCEIIYQSVLKGSTLRFPRFGKIRLDKTPNECKTHQINISRAGNQS
jgi:bifunctional non-homologous end joining protein LigD